MHKLRNNSHRIFWALGIALIITQVFLTTNGDNSELEFHVKASYYSIPYTRVYGVLGAWFILCGYGYWMLHLFKATSIGWMFFTHVVLSLGFIACFAFLDFEPDVGNLTKLSTIQKLLFFVLILFLVGQLVFLVNTLIAMIRIKRR
ncbi:hypothetical protein FVB32_07565 [Flagellimonas hymeniacidonis]|uniref:Uncharacterized protein n=1 Tax=Flagellimonas hymeniacidonis TaxID=2603628 RepID=A0A5C8V8S3_9FLAO|nr:hypothetical protein [Flagellimonas hymeniacidonis]TXN38142.1 hypothetical protein FVB32_07565 [Flagellimonas hymeniacidonis]